MNVRNKAHVTGAARARGQQVGVRGQAWLNEFHLFLGSNRRYLEEFK